LVAGRVTRASIVVVGICLVLWVGSFWLFDRGTLGWWLIPVFGVLCVLAFARQSMSDFVRSRIRRGEPK